MSENELTPEVTSVCVCVCVCVNFLTEADYMHTHTHTHIHIHYIRASQVVLVVKNMPADAGDLKDSGLIPGLGRSPGGGMATHFNTLAWKIT